MATLSLPAQLARTRNFAFGNPAHPAVSASGETVFFLRSRASDDPASCLWALDCTTGTERLLADPAELLAGAVEQLSPAELTRRERSRESSSGIVGYAADEAGELLAFALSGELWTVRAAGGEPSRLPAVCPVIDPQPDPSGRLVAYVSGGGLRVAAADGSGDCAVAEPDGPEVTFGLAAESMGRRRGYWWAPDGSRLLVARVDNSPVQRWYISDPADPAQPPAEIRYPAAGTANAEVSLWIARAGHSAGLTPVPWDSAAFEYLTAAGWDDAGPYAAVLDRAQQHGAVLGIDPASGAVSVLAEQRDSAWVQIVAGLPARTAAGELVTSADEPDTRRLVVSGEPVTPPGLQLHAVLAVDGEMVLFTGSDDPVQAHVWAWDRAAGLRRLSGGPGVHSGAARAGTVVLQSWAPDRSGLLTTVRRLTAPAGPGHQPAGDSRPAVSETGGSEPARSWPARSESGQPAGPGQPLAAATVIASHAERPVLEPRAELLTLGPSELRAALFLPSWHAASDGPLPVLVNSYGGPAAQRVLAARMPWTYTSQWFAEQGFAVLVTDGRGTPGRGPAWERTIRFDIAGPVLDDQIIALHAAAAQSAALDLGRVGIRGWSFGGYLAALAVLRRPDLFHAAVAGAPVLDQRLYNTCWRERHLGHPEEHPDAYDRCSPILEAASLSRPLLLVHGLADDNVVPAHTLRFSAALLAAGKQHEVLLLSRATHRVSDPAAAEHLLLHELDFLRRALGLPREVPAGDGRA
jgi:dipeptidyl-peptidase-4